MIHPEWDITFIYHDLYNNCGDISLRSRNVNLSMVLGKVKRPPKSLGFSLVKWRLLNSTCFLWVEWHSIAFFLMLFYAESCLCFDHPHLQPLPETWASWKKSVRQCYHAVVANIDNPWDKTTNWSGWKCPLLLIVTHINPLAAEYTGIPSLIILDVRKCVWHRGAALLQAVFKRSTCSFSLMWIFFNFRHAPSSNRACRVCKMPSAIANGLSQFACLKLWTK